MRGLAGLRTIAGTFGAQPQPQRLSAIALRLAAIYAAAWQAECDARRLFLWIPVAMGAGAILALQADRDPSLGFAVFLLVAATAAAYAARAVPRLFVPLSLCAAVLAGLVAMAWRVARVDAPILQREQILEVSGFLEEVDFRRVGARFVLRVAQLQGIAATETPYRIRLTTRAIAAERGAGDFVRVKARVMPPARASLPGGYDFARDAYFARLGGVGTVLGPIALAEAPAAPPLSLRFYAAVDRARNALARRVEAAIGGSAGAIGAAMVTGKRDFLDDPTREVIRQAGIFHIITIAGVQMTFVAGIFFVGLRRLFALSPYLALHHPIKKWAAALAIFGAITYDIATGSRVGTERALVMTIIMLGAVLCDRRALSMRNLALAVAVVVVLEPEALLGASFQLSFAAVAGLIAVWESRNGHRASERQAPRVDRNDRLLRMLDHLRHGPPAALIATLCATGATASFMAHNFHELSPYVLIGNPLTLTMIEVFAVPSALLGAFIYPLGLDGLVWHWLGLGIRLVLAVAEWLAALPGATLHLRAFAPWAIAFLALAVLCAVLWRTLALRLLAVPLAALGLWGTTLGERFDFVVAPSGDAVALRRDDGRLAAMGRSPSAFAVEQWLRADADGRPAAEAIAARAYGPRNAPPPAAPPEGAPRCDRAGCSATLSDGRLLALVLDREGFAAMCGKADIVVTAFYAPASCRPEMLIDRRSLARTGAVAVRLNLDEMPTRTARAPDEDRPWSRAPVERLARETPAAPADTSVDETLPPFR